MSLITIPIQVFPATNSGSDVSFRQLHRKCHTPIQLKKWCPHCNVELGPDDVVKAYEPTKGRMVVVEEKEIADLRPESTRTVDISDVMEVSTIDPIYIERSYYLAPDGKGAGSAFAVVREALKDRAAVGRLALHGREYVVAVLPREDGLLLHTLRTAGEVRSVSDVPGLEFASAKAKPEEVKLARQVLDSYSSGRDLTTFTDNYEEALREMLEAKHDDQEAVPREDRSAKPAKVVNLMDALRDSLARANRKAKSTPTTVARKSASVLAHSGRRRKAS